MYISLIYTIDVVSSFKETIYFVQYIWQRNEWKSTHSIKIEETCTVDIILCICEGNTKLAYTRFIGSENRIRLTGVYVDK